MKGSQTPEATVHAEGDVAGREQREVVATAVAERAPERLAHLIYLDALVPEHGESLVDIIGPASAAALEKSLPSSLPPMAGEPSSFGSTSDGSS